MLSLILLSMLANEPTHFTIPLATFTVSKADSCRCGSVCDCGKGKSCDCVAEYTEELMERAVKEDKNLIVYVNSPVVPVDGSLVCKATHYRGDKMPRSVKLYPKNGQLWESSPVRMQTFQPMQMIGACVGGR